MGKGAYITLVNGTKYNWTKTSEESNDMIYWGFPSPISPGTSITQYVERSDTGNNWGKVTYTLDGTDLNGTDRNFQVQTVAGDIFYLQIAFTNLATPGNPQGSTIILAQDENGYVNFVLSGEVANFTSTSTRDAWRQSNVSSWMQNNLNLLGSRSLRQICIPGSHDAGMSTLTGGTALVSECNTRTQTTGILGQLMAGARYFDIRPVISAGQYSTGHYSYVSALGSWQGANGQSIASIIEDVNTYTATSKELVILHLSHSLNTDVGNSSYREFIQSEWDRLFAQLLNLNNLFVAPNSTTVDLTTLTLDTFIGGNRAAVIVIVTPLEDSGISLGDYANKGFYLGSQFPVYDSYSNINDVGVMMNDQITKMKAQRPTPTACYFLLSWTLTQDATQVLNCGTGAANSILQLADIANPQLYNKLLNVCSNQSYPNIIYTDNIPYALDSSSLPAMAMAVNTKAMLPSTPTSSLRFKLSFGGKVMGWLGQDSYGWGIIVTDPAQALILELYPYNGVNYYQRIGMSQCLSVSGSVKGYTLGIYPWSEATGFTQNGSYLKSDYSGGNLSYYSTEDGYVYARDDYNLLDVTIEYV